MKVCRNTAIVESKSTFFTKPSFCSLLIYQIYFFCRSFWLVASAMKMNEMYLSTLTDIASKSERKILLLDKCPANVAERTKLGWRCEYQTTNAYDLKAVQAQSQFCLVAKTERLFQLNLIEALATNCIPVIFSDNTILPFAEVRFKPFSMAGLWANFVSFSSDNWLVIGCNLFARSRFAIDRSEAKVGVIG